MTEEVSQRVVIGLGNPGSEYHWTRHNIGLHAVIELAKKYGLKFHSERDLLVNAAKGHIGETNCLLVEPKTYMNESGKAIGRVVRFLKSDLKSLLIVVDDIETAFGETKLVFSGGTRGHNGLKSIKEALGSMNFMQLRIGVGRPNHSDVAGHVLALFSQDEMERMPMVMESALKLIEKWLEGV